VIILKKVIDVIGKEFIDRYLSEVKYYGYQSLVLNIIDAVFSISVKYESTLKVVERFANHVNIDVEKGSYSLNDFDIDFGSYDYETLANNVFKNRQRTSSTNGILKAEAVFRYIKTLLSFNINNKDDLLKHPNKDAIREKIALIPGHRSGIAFAYLLMLSGDTSTFKPDRHMYNFFGNFLGYGVLDESNLRKAFEEQLNIIKNDYPRFTIRTLDSLVWNYMKYKADRNAYQDSPKSTSNRKNKPYFMTNSKWYYFDESSYRFYLNDDAPVEAIESYNRFYSSKDKN
jgi:hypothetical protein